MLMCGCAVRCWPLFSPRVHAHDSPPRTPTTNHHTRTKKNATQGPALAAQLEEACWFVNLLPDDAWQPWALEFFYRNGDEAKRLEFLRAAEALTLYLDLVGDPALKRAR